MQITKDILVPAKDISFLTNYEARLMLNLSSSSDENLDDLIEMLVKWTSDEIALQCGRDFAKETLVETFRDLAYDEKRLFVSHYPIDNIDSIVANGVTLVEDADYDVDTESGRITRLNSYWAGPVVITYTGGYDLPHEAPPALQKAAVLLTREAYYASTRGDTTIRMVAHKESRVMYFDPNAAKGAAGGGGQGGSSPASRAAEDILQNFRHFYV